MKKWNWERKDKKNEDKDATPATGANTINTVGDQKKKKRPTPNASNITWYNCDKKGHYANKYPKPLNNQCWSWRPLCR